MYTLMPDLISLPREVSLVVILLWGLPCEVSLVVILLWGLPRNDDVYPYARLDKPAP